MVNLDIIRRRLKRLDEHLRFLYSYQTVSKDDFLHRHEIHSTVERDFQLVIECAQDIGNHIIADMGFREPESYADIFVILGEEGVLPNDFALQFSRISGFRNVLVHDYLDLNREIVYEHLQNRLNDFTVFRESITKKYFQPT